MLQYNENLDGFEGSDDDIDDDDTNIGDVMTIDDLIDNSEVDPDDEPDDAGNYCEDFIPGK